MSKKGQERVGWTVINRKGTKVYYVKGRVEDWQFNKTTGETDYEKALEKALQIVNNLRKEYYTKEVEDENIKKALLHRLSTTIDEQTAKEESVLLSNKLDKTNPRLSTLWTFGDTYQEDKGVYADYMRKHKPNYFQNRRWVYKRLFEFLTKTHEVECIGEVTTSHLQEFMDSLTSSKNTINFIDISIRALYNYTKQYYGITVTYPTVVEKPETQPLDKSEVLTEEQIKGILDYLSNLKNKAYYRLFLLLLHTGMRKSEALNLLWNNVCLDDKNIRVTVNESDTEIGVKRSFLKTSNSYRVVPISPPLMDALKEWKEDNTDNNPYVIAASGNRNAYTSMGRLKEELEKIVPNWHLHMLRHTYISRCINKGKNPAQVAKVVGDTVNTIMKVYYHFKPTDEFDDVYDSISE